MTVLLERKREPPMNLAPRPFAVSRSWQRIERWLATFAPAMLTCLRPGAEAGAHQAAEARLGVKLPADFKASCRLHDGMESESRLCLGNYDLYPVGGIADLRASTAEVPDRTPSWVKEGRQLPVEPVWWHPTWLDIAWGEAGGNGRSHLCLDLAPRAGGNFGQVLAWSNDGAVAEVLFPSFAALLLTWADQLEAGLYVLCQPLPFPLRKIPYLAQRQAAFRQRTPAKAILEQAISSGWRLQAPGSIDLPDLATQTDVAPRSSLDFYSHLSLPNSYEDSETDSVEWDLFTYGQAVGREDLSVYEQTFDRCVALYRAVLQMKDATPEDHCFAYYGWLSLYARSMDFFNEPREELLTQWQEEVEPLPLTHWAKLEFTLLQRWWR